MMQAVHTYSLRSHATGAEVLVGYDQGGLLCLVEIGSGTTLESREGMLRRLPVREEGLKAWQVKGSAVSVQFIPRDVSFEEFWRGYPKKDKKLRAKAYWDKLKVEERVRAYLYVAVLERKKRSSGEYMPNPDTYLKDRRWED